METDNRQNLIERFHERTGLNRQIAEETLTRFGWDLDVIHSFFLLIFCMN
jgi:hypothetical protein